MDRVVTALLGFAGFVLWMLFQLWRAKRGDLGKGIQKYFEKGPDHDS